jgi:hypothetical protein
MSDVNLLVFGCVLTFVGVAGSYVYLREPFPAGAERPREAEARSVDAVERDLSEVARHLLGIAERVCKEAR